MATPRGLTQNTRHPAVERETRCRTDIRSLLRGDADIDTGGHPAGKVGTITQEGLTHILEDPTASTLQAVATGQAHAPTGQHIPRLHLGEPLTNYQTWHCQWCFSWTCLSPGAFGAGVVRRASTMTTSGPLSRWIGDSGFFPDCPQETRTADTKVQAPLTPDPEHRPLMGATMADRDNPVGRGDGKLPNEPQPSQGCPKA
jgi:hypothetical protein